MKKDFLPVSLLLLLLFLISCSTTQKTASDGKEGSDQSISAVDFDTSTVWSEVLERARRENKLVFVDFYTTWCLPCRLMDAEVYPDKKLAKFLNANFINYKIDAEKGHGVNLAVTYRVEAYPTLCFMDADGVVLEKKIGAAFPPELQKMGEDALARAGR